MIEPPQQFQNGDAVLIATDPRGKVKTEDPWTKDTVVSYLGRGTYLHEDDHGNKKRFDEKLLALNTAATRE